MVAVMVRANEHCSYKATRGAVVCQLFQCGKDSEYPYALKLWWRIFLTEVLFGGHFA